MTNRPVNFNDPTGHAGCDGDYQGSCADWAKSLKYPDQGGGTEISPEELLDVRDKPSIVNAPWGFEHDVNNGYHIGPASNAHIPDYYGDLPVKWGDANTCTGGGGYAAPFCVGSIFLSFAFPYGYRSADANYWVSFGVTYDESVGISMSDIRISDNYPGPHALTSIMITNGDFTHTIYPGSNLTTGGFGQESTFPTRNIFNGNNRTSINIIVDHLVNTPNGTGAVPNILNIILPSLPELKYFTQTGEVLLPVGIP